MFQYCSVELTGEHVESTGVVAKNLSASWSTDKEKITISGISFQVDQVCTTGTIAYMLANPWNVPFSMYVYIHSCSNTPSLLLLVKSVQGNPVCCSVY